MSRTKEANTAYHTVTARKAHRCEEGHKIQPGDDYLRGVAFPGHDAVGGDVPWVLKLCVPCATRYDREMPPRRTKRQA